MTREDIIRMAREAGFQTGLRDYADGDGVMPFVTPVATGTCLPEIERLVQAAYNAGAAAEQKKWQDQTMVDIHEAVLEEREACAKVCETHGVHSALNVFAGGPDWYKHAKSCANAIRARGQI